VCDRLEVWLLPLLTHLTMANTKQALAAGRRNARLDLSLMQINLRHFIARSRAGTFAG
jgi:hypothetical protein